MPGDIETFLRQRLAECCRVAPESIDLEASFDELGVDSVARFTLTGELARHLDRSLAGDLTWQHPTVAALIRAVSEPQPQSRCLEVMREGPEPPLFLMPTFDGGIHWGTGLAACLDCKVVGLRLEAPDTGAVEDFGRKHAGTLMASCPGPFRLLGYSYGGRLAYEVARQLVLQGAEVSFLGVLDGHPRGRYELPLARVLELIRCRLLPSGSRRQTLRWLGEWLLRRTVPARIWLRLRLPTHLEPFRREAVRFHTYRPEPAPLRVTLLRSARPPISSLLWDGGGWEEFALGGVETVDIPGDHHGVVNRRHVGAIACRLALRLA